MKNMCILFMKNVISINDFSLSGIVIKFLYQIKIKGSISGTEVVEKEVMDKYNGIWMIGRYIRLSTVYNKGLRSLSQLSLEFAVKIKFQVYRKTSLGIKCNRE